ncbi:33 kDa chaperonin [Marinithermofilum abyssi]|uniref:33 kDa chaperonin n=2 Tax=Marinithermofilum abyssi TaxID=1571185 RepID=A0A8J2VD39_9BACL|nr:33 kDa chaperonin [Marinithermofilum abyssi]
MRKRGNEMSRDYAIRATSFNNQVRGFAAVTTELMSELQKRHHTWPVASAALGRTVSAGAMMGMMLKNEKDQLTIQITGDGPLRQIVVDADAKGRVRGYVKNPAVDLPLNGKGKLDVAKAVGNGTLHVVKDLGLKEPYRGSVRLVSGELGEDFTYYLTVSEQVPSSVGVGVLVDRDGSILASGGFIVQVMPEASEEVVDRLEQAITALPPVTKLLHEGATPEDLLQRVLGEEMQVHHRQAITFHCHCSKERIRTTLKGLGKKEVQQLLEEQGEAEVICHFCNERYRVERADLEELLQEMEADDDPSVKDAAE